MRAPQQGCELLPRLGCRPRAGEVGEQARGWRLGGMAACAFATRCGLRRLAGIPFTRAGDQDCTERTLRVSPDL